MLAYSLWRLLIGFLWQFLCFSAEEIGEMQERQVGIADDLKQHLDDDHKVQSELAEAVKNLSKKGKK